MTQATRFPLAILLVCLMVTAPSHGSGFYLGTSAGVVDVDSSRFDDAVNAGILLGYDFIELEQLFFSLEGELTTTLSDGDFEFRGNEGDWDINSQAAYFAARIGTSFYGKVRFGVAHSKLSAEAGGTSDNDSTTNISWGGSIGYMFTPRWGMQADYTMLDSDVDYINLGVTLRF